METSLIPRPLPKEGRGPGIHFAHARNYPRFLWDSYNSVPYCRLYPWTVCECPFYCLGVALLVRPPVVKVGVLFFTTVVYAVVIECFVSTTDAQILQSILDLVHTAGKTERSELSVLYGNISPMRKQCIPGPLPSFGRGLSTRLLEGILND